MMKQLLKIFSIVLILTACSKEPQDIEFGEANCDFCTMTITDDRFASQVVLNTGKAYKYCSIECMVRETNRSEEFIEEEIAGYYTVDLTAPIEFIDATEAHYLISEKIQSPMGENLSAFATKENAEETKNEYGGNIYTWSELLNQIK